MTGRPSAPSTPRGGVAVTLRQVQQADGPGPPFDEGADRGLVVFADDEVSFPLPGLGALLGRKRPVVDGEHRLLEPRPAPVGVLVGAAVVTAVVSGAAAPTAKAARTANWVDRAPGRYSRGTTTCRGRGETPAQVTADLLRPHRCPSISAIS